MLHCTVRGHYAVTTRSLRSARYCKIVRATERESRVPLVRDVRFMSMFVCLRCMCGKSPHVSAMLFKHVMFVFIFNPDSTFHEIT